MDFLDIRSSGVQSFLWEWLPANDIRHDYTLLDAMRYVQDEVNAGRQWLVGDLEHGLVFRVVVRNPKVIEPHIMGNVGRLRSLLPSALDIAFHRGVENVIIWTQHEKIASIVDRLGWGFRRTGPVPAMHWDGERLHDMHVVTLRKDEYAPPV